MLTCHEYLSRIGESRIQNISITIILIFQLDLLIHTDFHWEYTIQTRTQIAITMLNQGQEDFALHNS